MEGGKVLMNIVTGHDRQGILPGVVMSSYGEGRVLYCACGLESLYDQQGPDMVGKLLQKFVKTVSEQEAPYTLKAPAGLFANLTEKKNRMVLHLTNWTGNKFEKPWKNEYYLAPVKGVQLQIHIPEAKKVKEVSTLIEADYTKHITGRNLEIFLPQIDYYQAVVIELE